MVTLAVPTLESLAGEITRLQGELSEMAETMSVAKIVDRLPYVELSRWKHLAHDSIGICFSTEQTVRNAWNVDQQLSGTVLLAYGVRTHHGTIGGSIGSSFKEWEESSDLMWEQLYTAGVLFDSSLVTPLSTHGHGWELSSAQSQHGVLLGDLQTNGLGRYDWVRFFSRRHLQEIPEQLAAVYVHQDRGSCAYVGSRIKLPETLPLPFALLRAEGGDTHVRYDGFAFRPGDVGWGDGEFVQFVRHLGLGDGTAPEYAFDAMDNPYANPELPME